MPLVLKPSNRNLVGIFKMAHQRRHQRPLIISGLIVPDESEIKRERQKAKELRASQWWKRRCNKGVCYYCGEKTAPQELTMDHIVPLSRGGRSVKGNLTPACNACNTQKKYLLPTEWALYLDQIKE